MIKGKNTIRRLNIETFRGETNVLALDANPSRHYFNVSAASIDRLERLTDNPAYTVDVNLYQEGTRINIISEDIPAPASVVNVNIPYLSELYDIDRRLTNPEDKYNFYSKLAKILWLLIQDMPRAIKPRVNIGVDFSTDKKTAQVFYSLSDDNKQHENAYNWYGQNTSQWVAAGALNVQFKDNGEVYISSHT